jgi:hypothetical protein
MSDCERTGRRDLLMSRWHRPKSVRRWLSAAEAAMLERIDLDYLAACPFCHHAVALIEEKNSASSPATFSTRNTANLASDAGVPAFCVTYTCVCGVTGDVHETRNDCDIASVQVQQVWPEVGSVTKMEPGDYARWLLTLRIEHKRDCLRRRNNAA